MVNIKEQMENENQKQDIGSAPQPPSISVGDKFVAWAEKHWKLEEVYSNTVKDPSKRSSENASYEVVKQAFAWFIDQEIRNRIAGF